MCLAQRKCIHMIGRNIPKGSKAVYSRQMFHKRPRWTYEAVAAAVTEVAQAYPALPGSVGKRGLGRELVVGRGVDDDMIIVLRNAQSKPHSHELLPSHHLQPAPLLQAAQRSCLFSEPNGCLKLIGQYNVMTTSTTACKLH